MHVTRTLATAFAIGALAAPAAQARPADIHAPLAGAAQADKKQDMRSPDARDAAGNRRPLPGPPTWPANPQPIDPAPAVQTADGSGIDWAPIAMGIAAGLAAIAGLFVLNSRRMRRPQRPGVSV
jgi:hypothetical protein